MRQWTLVSSTSICASTAWPIAWTVRLSVSPAQVESTSAGAARDMVLELVDIAGDAAPRLVAAELVREVDVDRALHGRKDGRAALLFNRAQRSDGAMHPSARPDCACCSLPSRRRAQRLARAPAHRAVQPGRRLCHRRARTSPAIAPGTPRRPGGRSMSGRSTTISSPMASAGSRRPGSCCAPRPTGRDAAPQPFEVPPTSDWPNIVADAALRRATMSSRVIGPVEPVSVYRNPALNACAGGAPESTHREMGAVDMVPLRPITREALMSRLCAIHRAQRPSTMRRARLLQGAALPHRRRANIANGAWPGARGGYRLRRGAGRRRRRRRCPLGRRSARRSRHRRDRAVADAGDPLARDRPRWRRTQQVLCCAG